MREFQVPFHITGTLAANVSIVWTAPFDCQLTHVSAVGSNANDGLITIGTTSDADAYLTSASIGDSNVPVEFARSSFVGTEFPHIADGTVLAVALDFDGAGGTATANFHGSADVHCRVGILALWEAGEGAAGAACPLPQETGIMVDNSYQNQDLERLKSMAAKFHGIDVPVMAIREESGTVIITVQGGAELRCKFHDLMVGGQAQPAPPTIPGLGLQRKGRKGSKRVRDSHAHHAHIETGQSRIKRIAVGPKCTDREARTASRIV